MFAAFETIVLVENIPEKNLTKGMVGAIVEIYQTPDLAYEVEFCDWSGRTIALAVLLPNQIKIALKNEIDNYYSRYR